MKKYIITEQQHPNNLKLFRIKAIKSFGNVKKGELGGFIEKEYNLSHDNNCWVYDNARVLGNAEVTGDARVGGDARLGGNAHVGGRAHVCGYANVSGNAHVGGNALVDGHARVFGNAHVCGYANVFGNAQVFGNAVTGGNAVIRGEAKITESTNYLNISNLKYNLTITPQNVAGGCRIFTHEEFKGLTLGKCYDKTWTKSELSVYKSFLKSWKLMQNK